MKKNSQDATLRNVKAANKKLAAQAAEIRELKRWKKEVEKWRKEVQKKVDEVYNRDL